MTTTKKLLLAILILWLAHFPAIAQNLSKSQDISVRAPRNINIDGKLTEWGATNFKAYNIGSRIFYTLSNDDNNIYLSIRATDPLAIEKIIRGGVIFKMSLSLKKREREKDTDNVSIRYPIVRLVKFVNLTQMLKSGRKYMADSIANRNEIDSVVSSANKMALETFQEMQVHRIKSTGDAMISIYNEYGIKTAAQVDKGLNLVYEMAIPLKYTGVSITGLTKFSYNVELPGTPLVVNRNPYGLAAPTVVRNDGTPVDFDYEYTNNPSDFWGEYTLAKAP